MPDRGAKEANEQAYRKAVLDKLDRIIQLLTPPLTATAQVTMTQPGNPSGYTCAVCHHWEGRVHRAGGTDRRRGER